MENAVDALKIAFAVMVFTIALSLAMATFSQARQTSETVLYMNDKTNYYEYEEAEEQADGSFVVKDNTGNVIATYTSERIVGIETIIPTLYRYYKENYTVIFEGIDPVYYLDSTEKWNKNYIGEPINYFDLNSEIRANCPWVGTVNDIKKNLDLFLYGTTGYDFGNVNRKVKYSGFLNTYKDKKFLEELGEYATDRNYGMNSDGNLEIINNDKSKAILSQNASGTWSVISGTLKDTIGNPLGGGPFTLNDIATAIGNSSSTFFDTESGEIIELAKPTIKRVIKYTLMP